jgi:hypothetical protein
MAGQQETTFDRDELRAFRAELSALAQEANKYPFEYALGCYELLFESRDDIEVIVENLGESLGGLSEAA